MLFTAEELSDLIKIPVEIFDRRDLPHEKKFELGVCPPFSKTEKGARLRAIRETTGCKKKLRGFSALSGAWCFADTKDAKGWSRHSRALGQTFFGNSFRDLTQGSVRARRAVIFSVSPYLKAEDYWGFHLGINGIKNSTKEIFEICQLHEAGHLPFFYSAKEEKNKRIAYLSEVLADSFALTVFLERTDNAEAVQEYIHTRRFLAFTGMGPPEYWTAAASEAALRKKPLPPFSEVCNSICELQARVAEEVFRAKTPSNINAAWEEPDYFDTFSPSEEMSALARILENNGLSSQAHAEGLSVLRAYEHFCPEEAHEIMRPYKFSFPATFLKACPVL